MGGNGNFLTIFIFITLCFPSTVHTCELISLEVKTENGIVAEFLFKQNSTRLTNSLHENESSTQGLIIMTEFENGIKSTKSHILVQNQFNIYTRISAAHPYVSVQINMDEFRNFQVNGRIDGYEILHQKEVKCIKYANFSFSDSKTHKANDISTINGMLPVGKISTAISLLGLHNSELTNNVLEVLVIFDYKNSNYFDHDPKRIEFYIRVFYNSVNNRFRSIVDPKITIVVTGIHIVKSHDDQGFLQDGYNNNTSNTYDDNVVIYKLRDFVIQNKQNLPKHDVVQLLSAEKFVDRNFKNHLGLGFLKGACSLSTGKGVSLVVDRLGVFKGVDTAAHELAHLIGAVHDGIGNNCSEKGNIVAKISYRTGQKDNFYFSNCSIADMRTFISSNNASCLRSLEASSFYSYPTVLPGDILDLNQQCRIYLGRDDVEVDIESLSEEKICTTLLCRITKSPFTNETVKELPADSSPCGLNKVCLNGECVLKLQQIAWQFEHPYFYYAKAERENATEKHSSSGKYFCISRAVLFIFLIQCLILI